MRIVSWPVAVVVVLALLGAPRGAGAQGDPKVTLSGYVQPQYERHTRGDATTDRVILRRASISFEAELSDTWTAEFQVDAGPAASGGERLLVKDAFVQYTGWEPHGLTVTVGNTKLPFSRTRLISSSKRGLAERPLTGSSDYGVPGRAIAVKVDGWHRGRTLHWSAGVGASHQSQGADDIALDSIAEAAAGSAEGRTLAARLELHPFGETPRTQSDLERGPWRVVIGSAAFRWTNDHDVSASAETATPADRLTGVELSGGVRGRGLSLDAEYQRVISRAGDPFVTRGLYRDGRARLKTMSLEAGVMLIPRHLEGLAAVDALDAAAFTTPWRRRAIGLNWYIDGHRLKLSLMHRESYDHEGVAGARSRSTYLQSQFSF